MTDTIEKDVLTSIDDIIHPKTDRARFMINAWKKLFELKSDNKISFQKLTSSNQQDKIEEINNRCISDFELLYNENNTIDLKRDLLTKLTKLKILEEYFEFDFNNFNGYIFDIYQQFNKHIAEPKDEYSIELNIFPNSNNFILNFTAQELQDSLEVQKEELNLQKELSEKYKKLDLLISGQKEQITQAIENIDAESLENIVSTISSEFANTENNQRESYDLYILQKCINYANQDQDYNLLKITENLNNRQYNTIIFKKVKDQNSIKNYITEKCNDQIEEVISNENRLKNNISERKKYNILFIWHWPKIYKLNKEKKETEKQLKASNDKINQKLEELPFSDQITTTELINEIKMEKRNEEQNFNYTPLMAFTNATLETKRQINTMNMTEQKNRSQSNEKQIDDNTLLLG